MRPPSWRLAVGRAKSPRRAGALTLSVRGAAGVDLQPSTGPRPGRRRPQVAPDAATRVRTSSQARHMSFQQVPVATRRRLLLLVLAVVGLLTAAPASAQPAWAWPLAGPHVVSRPFGLGATAYAPGHRGADLPAAPGAVVAAAGAGRVSYAGLLAGRGIVVVVHGVLRTTYEPVDAVVGVGAVVQTGQQIGLLQPGHEGCPVAACLHWGLLRGDVYLDPVTLVEAGAVRLLPLAPGAPPPARLVGPRAPAPPPDHRLTAVAQSRLPALPGDQVPAPGRRAAPRADRPTARQDEDAARRDPAAPGHRTALAGTALALVVLVGSGRLVRGRRASGAPAGDPGRHT